MCFLGQEDKLVDLCRGRVSKQVTPLTSVKTDMEGTRHEVGHLRW